MQSTTSSQQSRFVYTPIVCREDRKYCPVSGQEKPCSIDPLLPIVNKFPAVIKIKNIDCTGEVIYACGVGDGTYVHSQAFIYPSPDGESGELKLTPEEVIDVQNRITNALQDYLKNIYECTRL